MTILRMDISADPHLHPTAVMPQRDSLRNKTLAKQRNSGGQTALLNYRLNYNEGN
jgi:hypothetical protein